MRLESAALPPSINIALPSQRMRAASAWPTSMKWTSKVDLSNILVSTGAEAFVSTLSSLNESGDVPDGVLKVVDERSLLLLESDAKEGGLFGISVVVRFGTKMD